jgi:hypothetical protein
LDEFPVYTPPVIVAMIANDVGRQRVVAMSGGTREFWIVDPKRKTVLITNLATTALYGAGETIPATPYHGPIAVDDIFAI